MAEEVEIGNVGGTTGVASEVTLVRLVAAMEKMAGVKGADPAKMKKIMEENHKAISDANYKQKQYTKEKEKATDSTSRFGKMVAGAAKALTAMTGAIAGQLMGSVVNFADALLKGKTDLKDFTSAIPFVGGYLGVFAGIIDTNIAAFRALSTSGAIFGQGLNDLRIKAAQAGVPLDMFVGMITENSERMRMFGGTTASAGQQFALFSRQFRGGAGRDLINLGFTVADLNELILDYAEYQDRIFGTDRRNRKISQEEVAAYGEELTRLAAVTGKQRKAIAEELNAKMEDVRNTQAISRMNKEQQENFRAATAISASLGPNMSEAITDMVDGIPSKGSVAEGLMVVSETFRAKAGDLKNMNLEEQMAFFDAVKNEVEARAGSFTEPAFQAILNAGGPLAEALKTQSELAQFTNADMKTELENLRARIETEKQVDAATKGFQDTIFDLQAIFNEVFFKAGGPLDDISKAFNTLATNLRKEPLKTQFTNTIQKVADTFSILTSKLETLISDISNFGFKAAFMGQKEIKDDQGNIIQQEVKGLFGNAGELGLSSLIGDLLGKAISGMFDSLNINWDTIAFAGGIGVAGLAAMFLLPLTGPIGIGILGALGAATAIWATKDKWMPYVDSMAETVKGWGQAISDGWDATKNTVTEAWSRAKNNVVAIGTSISDAWDSTTSAVATQWDTAKQRVSALGTSIANTWDDTKSAIATQWESAKSRVSSLGSSLANTWDETKGGIASKWESAKSSVSSIGDAIKNKFNDIDLSGFSWKDQFQNIWDAITGFFNFDFELPNFRDFLPTWLGGSGKTIEDGPSPQANATPPNTDDAVNKSNSLNTATAAIANLIDIPNLKSALAVIKDGMDSVQVETYADALASVAEQLTAINEAAKDQKVEVSTRRGTKTTTQTSAAANVLNTQSANQKMSATELNTLNTTMRDVLSELQAINKHTKATAKNDSNVANSVTINN